MPNAKARRSGQFGWPAVGAMSVLVLMGCTMTSPASSALPTSTPSDGPPASAPSASLAADAPLFPQQFAPDPMGAREALITGDLVLDGHCLRLVADQGGESYLLLWPSRVRLVSDPRVAVVDGAGSVLVRVGERIAAGGGVVETLSSTDITPTPPLPCEGPYWAVGDTLEAAP